MRKSCQWLGCAALMCFAALDLSGYSSNSVTAGFKLPWRKDRSTATRKDSKPSAEDSADLLAKARAFEREGDFPNATRSYREYIEAGGDPKAVKHAEDDGSVAQSEAKPSDKRARAKESKGEAGTRLTSKSTTRESKKSKDARFGRNLGVTESGTVEDPWANQPLDVPENVAGEPIQKKPTDDSVAAADDSATTDTTEVEQVTSPDAAVSSTPTAEGASVASQPGLDNLLDMDSGKLNWGDESKPAEGELPADAGPAPDVAQATPPLSDAPAWAAPVESIEAAAVATPEKTAEAGLPVLDFNSKVATHELKPPVVPDAKPAPKSESAWHTATEDAAASPVTAVVAETTVSQPEPADEFSPPVLEEEKPPETITAKSHKSVFKPAAAWASDEVASADQEASARQHEKLAAKCQGCEPMVYAQVVKLDSDDAEVRKEGLSRLAEMGHKAHSAAYAVRTKLKDSDPFVQAQAAWAWWEIENDSVASVATLQALLKQTDTNVVELACYILGDIGTSADSTVEALVLLRDHSEGPTRVQAAEAIIRIQGVDDKSLKALTTALKSKDGQVRWSAAVALGRAVVSGHPAWQSPL